MDVAAERAQFDELLANITSAAAAAQLRQEFEMLAAEQAAAVAAADAARTAVAEARITELVRSTTILAGSSPVWSWFSILLISGIVLGFFASIWAYFYGIGAARYSTIEATRPILVFTLIISMLAFGGLLIVRSLFTRQAADDYERRYRLAREVFLVFSGIFGTIIGFYFGAADHANSGPSIKTALEAGAVRAEIMEGVPPFLGLFTPNGETAGQQMTGDGRILTLKVDAQKACPVGGSVMVVDGRPAARERCRQSAALPCGCGRRDPARRITTVFRPLSDRT